MKQHCKIQILDSTYLQLASAVVEATRRLGSLRRLRWLGRGRSLGRLGGQATRQVGPHGEGGRREQDRNEDDEEGGSEETIHLEIYMLINVGTER